MQIHRKMDAYIYIRVSTKNQTYGNSLDVQEEEITSFCNKSNYNVISTTIDICSAFKLTPTKKNNIMQPNLHKLIHTINSNKKWCIIVKDITRFSRNIHESTKILSTIHTNGGFVMSVYDDIHSNNKLFFKKILQSQQDSEQKSHNFLKCNEYRKNRTEEQKNLQEDPTFEPAFDITIINNVKLRRSTRIKKLQPITYTE